MLDQGSRKPREFESLGTVDEIAITLIIPLMAWFGSGSGPWSGFPGYEEIAARLLRQYPTPELIKAVDGRPLTDQEVEGAARILGSWTPASDLTPIPADLRRILLEHCLKSPDQDRVERAKQAFSPDR